MLLRVFCEQVLAIASSTVPSRCSQHSSSGGSWIWCESTLCEVLSNVSKSNEINFGNAVQYSSHKVSNRNAGAKFYQLPSMGLLSPKWNYSQELITGFWLLRFNFTGLISHLLCCLCFYQLLVVLQWSNSPVWVLPKSCFILPELKLVELVLSR